MYESVVRIITITFFLRMERRARTRVRMKTTARRATCQFANVVVIFSLYINIYFLFCKEVTILDCKALRVQRFDSPHRAKSRGASTPPKFGRFNTRFR